MNTPSDPAPAPLDESPAIAPTATSATRPLYWSVRRELWENRSIYVAPLAVAAVVMFGFLLSTITLPQRMKIASTLDPAKRQEAITMPYNVIAGLLVATAFLVGAFYCLDALHGERRDRSILFWKSLPVSDRTTVLAKASIPLVLLPLLVFTIIVTAQMLMLLVSTLALLRHGPSLAMAWDQLPLFELWLALLYALTAIALWHAPIYGWLLLVSGWARRATFLWAVLPWLAICVFEGIAFRTTRFANLLGYRVAGGLERAFVFDPKRAVPMGPLESLTPGRFLSTPGLWIGLLLAALFVAAAVRLRRSREPI